MNSGRLIILYLFGLLLFSCEHEVTLPASIDSGGILSPKDSVTELKCDPLKVYYQNDIRPILTSNCAFSGCHDAGTATDGVILTTYENVIASDIVKAGDPDDSDLYERLTETDPNKVMPKGIGPLPADQITKIRQWIADGAMNSFCDERSDCDTANVSFSMHISPIIKNKCQGCHSGSRPGGGIQLTNYSEINIIAADQRLLSVVLHDNGFKAMPLGGEMLPECDIEQIRKWTTDGSPNN